MIVFIWQLIYVHSSLTVNSALFCAALAEHNSGLKTHQFKKNHTNQLALAVVTVQQLTVFGLTVKA